MRQRNDAVDTAFRVDVKETVCVFACVRKPGRERESARARARQRERMRQTEGDRGGQRETENLRETERV